MDNKKGPFIPNSTQIPNIILDFIIPQIPEAEARCLLYICRRTYGFHKKKDRISFTQFMKGIKNKDGKVLDYGAGLSRVSVSEGLRNLVESGLILLTKSTKGNTYSININYPVNKSVDKMVKEVVKKIYQYRSYTKIGKASRPKQVKLVYPQKKGKKGNKGNKVFIIKKEKKQKKEFLLKDIKKQKKELSKKLTLVKV